MCEIVFHNGEIVRDDKSIKMGGIYYLKRNRDIVKGRSNDIEKLSVHQINITVLLFLVV